MKKCCGTNCDSGVASEGRCEVRAGRGGGLHEAGTGRKW